MKLLALVLLTAAPPTATDAEAFLRKLLTPCELSTPIAPVDLVYEPILAREAQQVYELARPSTPDFFDADVRRCGVLPARPIASLQATKVSGDKLTVIANTGTAAMNNQQITTYLVVQTDNGPRIFDASTKNKRSLREGIEKRLKELLIVESERRAALDFVRATFTKPTANIYAPSLLALGTPPPLAARSIASVKAGLSQSKRTEVALTTSDASVFHTIVEQTDKGPRLWDLYEQNKSLRVALADASEARDTLPLSDDDAVAFMQKQFAPYVNPKLESGKTPLGAGLAELIGIDGQLVDGVPYITGDIVCDCQDFEHFSVESVKAVGRDGQMVRVEANFHVFPSDGRHATYIIVKTKHGLRIYDVIEDKDGSLRAQLETVVAGGYSGS